ncbi:MAG: 3-hydroxyacyl-ACP dehydratase FabZ [Patescibacteria group bacterium]
MDIAKIKSLLPYRYPFLLIDRVLECEPRRRIVAVKNVSTNEDFFNGHFPKLPVMPGVMIIESMAQASGLVMLAAEEHPGKIPFFTGISDVRFRRPVVPGDQLRIEVEVLKIRGNVGVVRGLALVDGEVAAEAKLMFALAR